MRPYYAVQLRGYWHFGGGYTPKLTKNAPVLVAPGGVTGLFLPQILRLKLRLNETFRFSTHKNTPSKPPSNTPFKLFFDPNQPFDTMSSHGCHAHQ